MRLSQNKDCIIKMLFFCHSEYFDHAQYKFYEESKDVKPDPSINSG